MPDQVRRQANPNVLRLPAGMDPEVRARLEEEERIRQQVLENKRRYEENLKNMV